MRWSFGSLSLSFAIFACSTSSVAPYTSYPGVDGSAPPDAGPSDAAADAGPGPINGCTSADFAANDHTAPADSRIIQAPNDVTPAQYLPHCMRVKVEQLVTWQGDLADHPLELVLHADGPDAGSFTIGAPDGSPDGTTVIAHQSGTLAFKCRVHPSTMFGAVQIVP